MDSGKSFGELRSLVCASPSLRSFEALMSFVEGGSLQPEELDYIESKLRRWPDDLPRDLPKSCIAALRKGRPMPEHTRFCNRLFWNPSHQEELARLVSNPLLRNLRHLHLGNSTFDDRSANIVAAHMDLPSLQILGLGANKLTSAGLEPLLASPQIPRLLELRLEYNELDASAGVLLAQVPFERLQLLSVEGNHIGDHGVESLLQAGWLDQLRHLNLSNTGIGNEALIALSSCEDLAQLEFLNLDYNLVGAAGRGALRESPYLRRLIRNRSAI